MFQLLLSSDLFIILFSIVTISAIIIYVSIIIGLRKTRNIAYINQIPRPKYSSNKMCSPDKFEQADFYAKLDSSLRWAQSATQEGLINVKMENDKSWIFLAKLEHFEKLRNTETFESCPMEFEPYKQCCKDAFIFSGKKNTIEQRKNLLKHHLQLANFSQFFPRLNYYALFMTREIDETVQINHLIDVHPFVSKYVLAIMIDMIYGEIESDLDQQILNKLLQSIETMHDPDDDSSSNAPSIRWRMLKSERDEKLSAAMSELRSFASQKYRETVDEVKLHLKLNPNETLDQFRSHARTPLLAVLIFQQLKMNPKRKFRIFEFLTKCGGKKSEIKRERTSIFTAAGSNSTCSTVVPSNTGSASINLSPSYDQVGTSFTSLIEPAEEGKLRRSFAMDNLAFIHDDSITVPVYNDHPKTSRPSITSTKAPTTGTVVLPDKATNLHHEDQSSEAKAESNPEPDKSTASNKNPTNGNDELKATSLVNSSQTKVHASCNQPLSADEMIEFEGVELRKKWRLPRTTQNENPANRTDKPEEFQGAQQSERPKPVVNENYRPVAYDSEPYTSCIKALENRTVIEIENKPEVERTATDDSINLINVPISVKQSRSTQTDPVKNVSPVTDTVVVIENAKLGESKAERKPSTANGKTANGIKYDSNNTSGSEEKCSQSQGNSGEKASSTNGQPRATLNAKRRCTGRRNSYLTYSGDPEARSMIVPRLSNQSAASVRKLSTGRSSPFSNENSPPEASAKQNNCNQNEEIDSNAASSNLGSNRNPPEEPLDFKLNEKAITDDLLALLLTGHLSTSLAVTWTLYNVSIADDIQRGLMENPELCNILQSELLSLTLDKLNEAKFLPIELGIKESLRLHPPIPFFVRATEKHLKISRFIIPPGNTVAVAASTIQRDKSAFEEPDKFKSQRLGEFKVVPENFMPFSKGARECLGSEMGMMIAKLLVVNFLSCYKIGHRPDNISFTARGFTIPVDGRQSILCHRNQARRRR